MQSVVCFLLITLVSGLSFAQQPQTKEILNLKVCSNNNSRPMSMEIQHLGISKDGSPVGNLKFESIDPETKKSVSLESAFVIVSGAEIPVEIIHSGQNIILQQALGLKKISKIELALLATQKSKKPFALFEISDIENNVVFTINQIDGISSNEETEDSESQKKLDIFYQIKNPLFAGSTKNCK